MVGRINICSRAQHSVLRNRPVTRAVSRVLEEAHPDKVNETGGEEPQNHEGGEMQSRRDARR